MGWSNFIILPKQKLAIEISRYVDKEELCKEEIEEFLKTVNEFDYEIFEKEYQKLTISDLADLIDLTEKAIIFKDIYSDNFLIWYLELTGKKYEIITEFEFEEIEKEFKEYKVIRKWDENE